MKRIDAIGKIASCLDGELVVANLGFPSRELYSIADRPEDFYMLGTMGLASSIGLGLALSTDKGVVVLDGDGSVLMNLGSLASISYHSPGNLLLVVLDNGTYGSTGDQCTMAKSLKLEEIARGCGLVVAVVTDEGELEASVREALVSKELKVLVVKVEPGNADVPVIPLSPTEIRERFMRSIAAKP